MASGPLVALGTSSGFNGKFQRRYLTRGLDCLATALGRRTLWFEGYTTFRKKKFIVFSALRSKPGVGFRADHRTENACQYTETYAHSQIRKYFRATKYK
jgi:hypothetical protein